MRGNPINRIDPSGLNDITVNYYGGGTGHIGLSIDGGPSNGFYGGGISTSDFLSGKNGQGIVLNDFPQQGSPTSSVTIPASTQQAKNLQDAIDSLRRNPGDYNLYNNNCTTKAVDMLTQSGIPNVPKAFVPELLMDVLGADPAVSAPFANPFLWGF